MWKVGKWMTSELSHLTNSSPLTLLLGGLLSLAIGVPYIFLTPSLSCQVVPGSLSGWLTDPPGMFGAVTYVI